MSRAFEELVDETCVDFFVRGAVTSFKKRHARRIAKLSDAERKAIDRIVDEWKEDVSFVSGLLVSADFYGKSRADRLAELRASRKDWL